MNKEASERTIVPAPSGAQLVTVGPDGHLGNFSTVVAFVVDRDDCQIVDVVTNTGDKLHCPHGHTGALILGDRVSFEGQEHAWEDFFTVMLLREKAAPPRRG